MEKFFFVAVLGAIFSTFELKAQVIHIPAEKVSEKIDFQDDLAGKNLLLAIDRQMDYFKRNPRLKQTYNLAGKAYTLENFKSSLLKLKSFVNDWQNCLKMYNVNRGVCETLFKQKLQESFQVYRILPTEGELGWEKKRTLFTAYYSPDLHGSYQKTQKYKFPIYSVPSSEEQRKLSRREIDFQGALQNRGLELVWVQEDWFELYLFQVQGGGRVWIETPQGKVKRYLSYAGANGLSFNFISSRMVELGLLNRGETSIENQRRVLKQHRDKEEDILASNPSYVFFKFTDSEPLGVGNIPLTEGRSCAIDMRRYKFPGLIQYFKTFRPIQENLNDLWQEWSLLSQTTLKPFSRFFIAQDTGGAIRGNARVDMYFGYGPDAEFVAYNTKVLGEQFVLLLK